MSIDALPDRSHRRWYVVEGYTDLARILVVVAEIVVLLSVTIVALYFQINDRPKIPKIYHTNDPLDPVIVKESYACGCNLPATIQSAENPSIKPNSSIDRCYDKSELETIQILMFPKAMTGAKLRPVLNAFVRPEQVYNKTLSEGYFFSHEAHDLYGEVVRDSRKDDINALFFNGNRLVDYTSSVSYMRNYLISFPKSFLRLAFSYNCTDCDTCALRTINNISAAVSNDETWGTCYMWGSGNQCPRSYQAKCSLYPTKSLPTNFAIRGFFERLLNLSGIEETDIHHVSPSTIYAQSNRSTSLQPSSLYLDLKQIEKSSIEMGFVEVDRGSAFWVSVRNLFPGMDTSCSNVSKVQVCNGTSVCNVFTNDNSTNNYELKCKDLVNRTECLSLMAGSTADNVDDLTQGNPNFNAWDDVLCGMADRTPQCFNITPNLVAWNISQRMAGNPDALNEFVYENILQEEWAQQAGVCINTFDDVYRYPQDDSGSGNKRSGENDTKYLETNCTSNYLGNDYCWLTGRYHDVTDDQRDWKNLTRDSLYRGVPQTKRFVCYRVDKQSIMTWSILTFGAIFGWIGTVHLIFQFFRSLIDKLAHRLEGHTCCLQWGLFRSISETNSPLDSGSMSATSSDSSQSVWLHQSVFKRSSSVNIRDSM